MNQNQNENKGVHSKSLIYCTGIGHCPSIDHSYIMATHYEWNNSKEENFPLWLPRTPLLSLKWVKIFCSRPKQCCQHRGLPTQLGYFEILCRGSKNCWAGGLKLGYFSFVCLRQVFFLQVCQFPVNSESFWASSMSKNILFINFRD